MGIFPHSVIHSAGDVTRNFEHLARLLMSPTPPVSRARVLATAYQPDLHRSTLVVVTFSLKAKAGEVNAVAEVKLGVESPPGTLIAQPQVENENAAVVKIQIATTFIVPPGFYYEFKKAVGSVAIQTTFEYGLNG